MTTEKSFCKIVGDLVSEYGVEWDDFREYQIRVNVWNEGYSKLQLLLVYSDGEIRIWDTVGDIYTACFRISYQQRLRIYNHALDHFINTNDPLVNIPTVS